MKIEFWSVFPRIPALKSFIVKDDNGEYWLVTPPDQKLKADPANSPEMFFKFRPFEPARRIPKDEQEKIFDIIRRGA